MIRIIFEHIRDYENARSHLDEAAERAGFFLSRWSAEDQALKVFAWRPIDEKSALGPDEFHLALSDELRGEVIRWATRENGCLIEAHSHGHWSPAEFSKFDLQNLRDWVPHVWWRLQGRPYAALVTSVSDFDGLAWVGQANRPQQVGGIVAGQFVKATGTTLKRTRWR